MTRYAVVGSRAFKDELLIYRILAVTIDDEHDTIVSGCAEGPDTWAEEWAKDRGVEFKGFPPDKSLPSPARFFARNTQIAEDCDQLLGFWDGVSGGMLDTAGKVERLGKRVVLIVEGKGVATKLGSRGEGMMEELHKSARS